MTVPTSQTYGVQRTPIIRTPLEITRITPVFPSKVYIQWIYRLATVVSGYTFSIYRSGSSEGPWELLNAEPLVDVYNFVDTTVTSARNSKTPSLYSYTRNIYYRVDIAGPEGTYTNIHEIEAFTDRRRRGMINKLRRDAYVMLKKGNGTEAAILKRKWWGTSCTCISKTGIPTRTHCSLCQGTGIISGYWDPVYTYMSRSVSSKDEPIDTTGVSESNYLTAIAIDLPLINPRDVIVFLRDNKRYVVDRVTNTEIQTVTVHQEMTISELGHNSIEYNIKVDNWHEPPWF
jgi:hypothetical protein